MKLTAELTDDAILRELGARLARRRVEADLTQKRLAEEAGVSKSTLEHIEAGRSTDSRLLVRVMRALKLVEGLEGLVPDRPPSPIALLRQKGRERKRVRSAQGPRSSAAPQAVPGTWKWGE
jgi:transcriptional regulator with XRE-family HTH domain